MTIISTENAEMENAIKTVLGIFILTAILGIFAVERAFSISRSSSLMNSFSDLYTLAFKNLTSLFLPIVLSMFATTLFFDEQKNDTLKGLLIIPISKTQLYFSKIAVVIFMSLALCLLTFAICILGGFLAGGFTDLNTETILQAGLLFLAGGVLVPLAMLPVIFLATLAKGYVLPIGAALLYLVPVVLIPSGIMGLHPLASVMGIYPIFHLTQQKWLRNGRRNRNNYISEYLFNFLFCNWKYFSHCFRTCIAETDLLKVRIYDEINM